MTVAGKQRLAARWAEVQDAQARGEISDKEWEVIFSLQNLPDANPEVLWDVILEVLQLSPSEQVVGMLAAGPLEDLIDLHGPAFIDRIEDEARRNKSFRYLLGGVWESSSKDVWSRIEAVRGEPW